MRKRRHASVGTRLVDPTGDLTRELFTRRNQWKNPLPGLRGLRELFLFEVSRAAEGEGLDVGGVEGERLFDELFGLADERLALCRAQRIGPVGIDLRVLGVRAASRS